MSRPTWAEIDLDNLAYNFHSVKNYVDENIKYMAVVKADAYGHGALQCAHRLEREGIDWFGVALPEEGIELRKSGIHKHILCLGSFWAGQEKEILNYNVTPVVYRLELAERFDRAAAERGVIADVHVKVDTGMNRIGVRFDELKEFLDGLKKFENLKVDGVMTHFAAADSDDEFTNLQVKRFNEAVETFHQKGFRPTFKDLANSPGTLGHANAHGNMVRLGGVLYGLWRDVLPKNIQPPRLKAVMSLHTKITQLKTVLKGETIGYGRTFKAEKDLLVATVPIGYQDGYPRALSNSGCALVNGIPAEVVGRISMDWTMVDVTAAPDARIGDEVLLIGEQNGARVTAEEIAEKTQTISYEVTCGISRRVTRLYKDDKMGRG